MRRIGNHFGLVNETKFANLPTLSRLENRESTLGEIFGLYPIYLIFGYEFIFSTSRRKKRRGLAGGGKIKFLPRSNSEFDSAESSNTHAGKAILSTNCIVVVIGIDLQSNFALKLSGETISAVWRDGRGV